MIDDTQQNQNANQKGGRGQQQNQPGQEQQGQQRQNQGGESASQQPQDRNGQGGYQEGGAARDRGELNQTNDVPEDDASHPNDDDE